MAIVGGFDVHRQQITFNHVETETGEVRRGKISPATRAELRKWLEQFDGQPAAFAVEGCTGWRFVVEELQAAGIEAHVAEPADTAALRGPKKRAKTDQLDSRHLRELLCAGTSPSRGSRPHTSSKPGSRFVSTSRSSTSVPGGSSASTPSCSTKAPLPNLVCSPVMDVSASRPRRFLPPAPRPSTSVLHMIDAIAAACYPLHHQIAALGRRQPGCCALRNFYGIGAVTSVAIWAELGDCRRFSSSDDAVRHTGLDVTVHSSDNKLVLVGISPAKGHPCSAGRCSRPPNAWPGAAHPDHDYYLGVRDRLGVNRATLSVARKLARRCHHTLRALGDNAFAKAS